jgi:hypothetical protein
MGVDGRLGRYDGHGPHPHGSIIGSRTASSHLLLNRWKHGSAFLFDTGYGDGRRRSTGRGCAIFGAAVAQVTALRADTLKKGVVLAILYVEILSQPILATTPILLKMTAHETLQWFSVSFVMHFMLAVVLGVIVSYGLRLATAAKPGRS